MRTWMIPPQLMCRKHLLGEHVELHMMVGSIKRGLSIAGFVRDELIDTAMLKDRHDIIALEMTARGYNHNSPLEYDDVLGVGRVDPMRSIGELHRRCADCRELIISSGIEFDASVSDASFNRVSKRELKASA